MLTKIMDFVKENQDKIVLVVCILLIALLCFSLGYIFAKTQEKEPIEIIEGKSLILIQNENS
jgi:Tfp pilus assembly protein PilO